MADFCAYSMYDFLFKSRNIGLRNTKQIGHFLLSEFIISSKPKAKFDNSAFTGAKLLHCSAHDHPLFPFFHMPAHLVAFAPQYIG